MSFQQALAARSVAGLTLSETHVTRGSVHYTFTNATHTLRIEVFGGVDADTAQQLVNDGVMSLQALYANALSPYPGDISNQVVAAERYRPKLVTKEIPEQLCRYFVLFANERQGYGATAPDLVQYRSLLGWRYCAGSQFLYKVRLFAPVSTDDAGLERLFLSLDCP